ncbi:HNH endonuclease [bacterium]|nr:HNH endonuclease [bacterium]
MGEEITCSWDPYGCQSLLGYGKAVHERSGGVCAYCGMGKDGLTFDMWRQLSVDHVIPTSSLGSQGWSQVEQYFPNLLKNQRDELYKQINKCNLVTACNFCNSMTSRMKDIGLDSIMPEAPDETSTSVDDPPVQAMLSRLRERVDELLLKKRKHVLANLARLNQEFVKTVVPNVKNAKHEETLD